MNLAPLLDAAPAIPLHALAAMSAFVLGLVQFAAPKGTLPHRTLGWIWVLLMASVAVSSFWIHQIRLIGPWSPIHLLSIFTLTMLPLALHGAFGRTGNALPGGFFRSGFKLAQQGPSDGVSYWKNEGKIRSRGPV
jgi:uncharacterized membrane protein